MIRNFAFFDVDYTLYDGYTANDFQKYLLQENLCDASFAMMNEKIYKQYLTGQITYSQGARAALELQALTLEGKTIEEVALICENFIKAGHKLYPFVVELFSLLKKAGFTIVLISGSSTPVIQVIGRLMGADLYFASELEIENGQYSGKLKRMMNDEEKLIQLQSVMKNQTEMYSLGFGDTTGDIFMLSEVNKAFVVNPHQEEMRKIAIEKGWAIVTVDTILEKVRKTLATPPTQGYLPNPPRKK